MGKDVDKKKYAYPYREQDEYKGVEYDIKAKTKSELVEKRKKKYKEIEDNLVVSDRDMTNAQWGEIFLDKFVKPNVESLSTYNDYVGRLNNYIYKIARNKPVSETTQVDCQDMLNLMSGYSMDRINKVHNTIVRFYETAEANGKTAKSPARFLQKPPGKKPKKRRLLTPTERALTLEVAKDHIAGKWVLTMLYSGLRSQEIMALQGRHLDFNTGYLIIENAYKKDGYVGEPKTDAGYRKIPMTDDFLNLFKNDSFEPFEFVFKRKQRSEKNTKKDLRGMTPKAFYLQWNDFKKQMQLKSGAVIDKETGEIVKGPFEDLEPYMYRGAFATDAADKGMDARTLKYIMGHEDTKVADKFYISETEVSLLDAKNILNINMKDNREPVISPKDNIIQLQAK